jgi:ATP-dependent Clp protease ATP-binding subunit ClpC
MFERFTDQSRRVMVFMQESARELQHNYMGTEHLLLGLLEKKDHVAGVALAELGVTQDAVKAQVFEIIGQGRYSIPTGQQLPYTPRVKKVLELGLRESLQLGHSHIGPEHLLLAIAREDEGVAAQILNKLGATQVKLRQAVLKRLGTSGSYNLPLGDLTIGIDSTVRRQAALRCRQLARGLMISKDHPLRVLLRTLEPQAGAVKMTSEDSWEILLELNSLQDLLPGNHPLLAVAAAIKQSRADAIKNL